MIYHVTQRRFFLSHGGTPAFFFIQSSCMTIASASPFPTCGIWRPTGRHCTWDMGKIHGKSSQRSGKIIEFQEKSWKIMKNQEGWRKGCGQMRFPATAMQCLGAAFLEWQIHCRTTSSSHHFITKTSSEHHFRTWNSIAKPTKAKRLLHSRPISIF